MKNTRSLPRYRLTSALLMAMALPAANIAFAQDNSADAGQQANTDQSSQPDQDQSPQTDQQSDQQVKNLNKVVVTGSLIPQTEVETAKPLTIITAEDMKQRGFTSVQDALHQSSISTGGVQGNQTSASFTQGAETNSLFGLNPGYTKYLIDGRPMANYPALYNGSDVFNNISGIPIDLVERIEILPGGQSSLYGSDAIAGVVNIILKKSIDGGVVSARLGGYHEGGGFSRRISIADSFESKDDRFRVLLGAQYEKSDPIWAYQRELTKQINLHGSSAPVATRDFLVYGRDYYFRDPDNCANVLTAFGGTEALQNRPGRSEPYCGSFFTPGYSTLKNSKESTQVYTHATFDISPNMQLYGDLLYSKEKTRYHIGAGYTWWGTGPDYGAYIDPNIGFVNLQRGFAPEDMGGDWERAMNENDDRSYAATLGLNGTFGDSYWDYDVGVTRTEYKLTENDFARLRGPIDTWFRTHVLGPELGTYYGYPIFSPDYAEFYKLIPADDFNSFTDITHSRSKTYDNMFRAQVTNSALFSLPGGDAGIAIAVEAGSQGWSYNPDPRLIPDPVTLVSDIWGTTSVSGHGSRSRYAVTGEIRLPLWDPLTVSASARYDSYKAAGEKVSKPTYNLGIEYRPIHSLLFRAQYGTAFKAPTLADQFQGVSGFYSFTNDYLYCYANGGYDVADFADCVADPNINGNNAQPQYFGTTSGNVDLEPINADVWSYGVVWAPTAKFSMAADFHHWNIKNEVATQSVDQLMKDDLNCTPIAQGGTGMLDPNSGTCQAAFNQIVRDAQGVLQSVHVSKINVAREVLNAVTFDLHYLQSLGRWGDLTLNGSWTRNLKHEQQTFPTDPVIDLLNNGYYSRDPIYRANASLGWNKGRWTTTLYANYIGPTGNSIAWNDIRGFDAPGGGRVSSYTTYNASLNFDVTPDFKVSFITTNLFNRMPDMDVGSYDGFSGAPYNSDMFDVYGRAYYLEARWNFGKRE